MQVKTYLTESTGAKVIQIGIINTRGIKGPGYSLTIGFPAWAVHYKLLWLYIKLGPLTSDNRPCNRTLELVRDFGLVTYLPFMEKEKDKSGKKEVVIKID